SFCTRIRITHVTCTYARTYIGTRFSASSMEAALYVVSTRTTEEAIRIFTEGLKPVRGVRKMGSSTTDSSDDDVELGSSEDSTPRGGGGTGCRTHGRSIKRDIATAPF
uniref:Uncharacterized protein n=1 Tax=Aegilops tauschii subsp. strangulata TaxID=200361 RepID=A0A453FL07_AEGTS